MPKAFSAPKKTRGIGEPSLLLRHGHDDSSHAMILDGEWPPDHNRVAHSRVDKHAGKRRVEPLDVIQYERVVPRDAPSESNHRERGSGASADLVVEDHIALRESPDLDRSAIVAEYRALRRCHGHIVVRHDGPCLRQPRIALHPDTGSGRPFRDD